MQQLTTIWQLQNKIEELERHQAGNTFEMSRIGKKMARNAQLRAEVQTKLSKKLGPAFVKGDQVLLVAKHGGSSGPFTVIRPMIDENGDWVYSIKDESPRSGWLRNFPFPLMPEENLAPYDPNDPFWGQ